MWKNELEQKAKAKYMLTSNDILQKPEMQTTGVLVYCTTYYKDKSNHTSILKTPPGIIP